MELSQRRIAVPSCASIVSGMKSRSSGYFYDLLRSYRSIASTALAQVTRRALFEAAATTTLFCNSANSATIVCTTRHLPIQCRLGHLDGAHCLA
jgi:hypothetical protein